MEEQKLELLRGNARTIRKWVIEMIAHLGVGHIGASLSCVDVLTVLYFDAMRVDPERPRWVDRDHFILSKGHGGPGLYATLALRGYFPKEMLMTLNRPDTNLPSHCDMRLTPGIDQTTGSLGQGISCAVGHALAARVLGKDYRVYSMVGDGELQEGQVWEALMLAGAQRLANFVCIVDQNGLQVGGNVRDVVDVEPLADKLRAFQFHVLEVDGHDVGAIAHALALAKAHVDGPTCLIAHTIKGKGYAPAQGQRHCHLIPVSEADCLAACAYIDAQG